MIFSLDFMLRELHCPKAWNPQTLIVLWTSPFVPAHAVYVIFCLLHFFYDCPMGRTH